MNSTDITFLGTTGTDRLGTTGSAIFSHIEKVVVVVGTVVGTVVDKLVGMIVVALVCTVVCVVICVVVEGLIG